MHDGSTRRFLAAEVVEMDAVEDRVFCRKCGSDRVRRVYRKGFWQENMYPLFGYYPWRCASCGERAMLRKRNKTKTECAE